MLRQTCCDQVYSIRFHHANYWLCLDGPRVTVPGILHRISLQWLRVLAAGNLQSKKRFFTPADLALLGRTSQ